MYVLKEYPQISQTYIKAEIESVEDDYDLTIVARQDPNLRYEDHKPYRSLGEVEQIQGAIDEVRPDILHTHYLDQLWVVGPLAEANGLPFTVRAHSFDALALRPKARLTRVKQRIRRTTPLERSARFRSGLPWLGHELCLGVLAFPFARPWLEAVGVPGSKIIDSFPVVAVRRFWDRSPNGDAVMNTGVATPKKRMQDFLELAAMVPERQFRLYGMGYHIDELAAANAARGGSVEFVPPVQPDAMPAEYKKHQWLVYTGDFEIPTVGWPMAVAEAQASGVGVCMPRLRPDLAQYVGEGGFLYDSLDQVASLMRQPVPEDVREAGFAQARKSDIAEHKYLLTDLWDRVRRPLLR